VVIIITPLAALEPYKPVAAASLSTVRDSMSLGLALPPIIPSTTYKGDDPAVIELEPLMTTFGESLGLPEGLDTITPGAFPCNKSATLLEVTSRNASPDTTLTELDNSVICFDVYPTTTTSCKFWASSAKVTSIVALLLISISWVT